MSTTAARDRPHLTQEKICMTDSGAMPNKPCIFPFKFNGVLYSECTWTSAPLTEHKPWCSTFVDETGAQHEYKSSFHLLN